MRPGFAVVEIKIEIKVKIVVKIEVATLLAIPDLTAASSVWPAAIPASDRGHLYPIACSQSRRCQIQNSAFSKTVHCFSNSPS
mgnify:CR=1 FL=1